MDVVKSQRSNFQRSTSNSGSNNNSGQGAVSTAASGNMPEKKVVLADTTAVRKAPASGGKDNGVVEAPPRMSRGGPFQRLRRRRRHSAPPAPGRKKRLIEEHFRVDFTENKHRVILPGVPKHDDDWARDSHDFFNLIVLIPVVALNVINWNWEIILSRNFKSVSEAWTGDHFQMFFIFTLFYFVVDLLWIIIDPSCVKSPSTIMQHHFATILYIMIPYFQPDLRWGMGACMLVEVNTWFLIARRVFNKQGFPPWIIDLSFVSIRVKLISLFFYVTWIGIRCVLYPYLLLPFTKVYLKHSDEVGTKFNITMLVVPLHGLFCLLNLKWSYDLLMSKIRYWRRRGNYKEASKGL